MPVAAAVLNGVRGDRFRPDEEPALAALAATADGPASRAAAAGLRHLAEQRSDDGYRRRLAEGTGLPVARAARAGATPVRPGGPRRARGGAGRRRLPERPPVIEAVEGRRIVVCCGAGGVGKTTVSAALGLGLARRGRPDRGGDHRPGAAARHRPRDGGPVRRAAARPGRPRAGRRRALGAAARREGDLRPAGLPRGADPGGARADPRQPDLPPPLGRRRGGPGLHGRRAAARAGRRAAPSTPSCWTRRRRRTPSTSSTRRGASPGSSRGGRCGCCCARRCPAPASGGG